MDRKLKYFHQTTLLERNVLYDSIAEEKGGEGEETES